MSLTKEQYMQLGIDKARFTMSRDIGGPFGAVIVKDGSVVTVASNRVLATNDPTAHAEVTAIREACQILGTYDLSGCELYATGYPCPMCMGAIIWANIKKVCVSGMPVDAAEIGFRDDYIYQFIQNSCTNQEVLEIEPLDREPARMLYADYAVRNKIIY